MKDEPKSETTNVEKLGNLIDGLKEENELVIALEDSLKPKYENDVFTWHQIKNAILKVEVLNGAANTESQEDQITLFAEFTNVERKFGIIDAVRRFEIRRKL